MRGKPTTLDPFCSLWHQSHSFITHVSLNFEWRTQKTWRFPRGRFSWKDDDSNFTSKSKADHIKHRKTVVLSSVGNLMEQKALLRNKWWSASKQELTDDAFKSFEKEKRILAHISSDLVVRILQALFLSILFLLFGQKNVILLKIFKAMRHFKLDLNADRVSSLLASFGFTLG